MSKYVENHRDTLQDLNTFFDDNRQTLVEEVPAFAGTIDSFNEQFNALDRYAEESDKGTEGSTNAKHEAEKELIPALVRVASSLFTLGRKLKDEPLKAMADVKEYELERLRDTELKTKGASLLDEAEKRGAALVPHGITPEKLTAAKQIYDAFVASLGNQGNTAAQVHGSRGSLKETLQEIEETLDEEADHHMDHVREKHPELYDAYMSIRVIKDRGIRHNKKEEPKQNGNSTPPNPAKG